MTQFFPPSLEGDELEKKTMRNKEQNKINRKKTSNAQIFTSEGEFKKHEFKELTPYLIKAFTEQGIEEINTISIILGGMLCLAAFIIFLNGFDNPGSVIYFGMFSFIIFFTCVWIDHILKSCLEYYRDTLCRICGKEYACSEIKYPEITEISTPEEYTIKVTRYWKCKFCGNLDIREGQENFTTKKGRKKTIMLKRNRCPQCGKYEIEEAMDPDVKEINNTRTTRRYYKCNYCGYKYTDVNKEQIYSGT